MARSVQQTQRQLIACALEVLADADFALAGSGAIREHGMTQRPTNDIDLFTVMQASTRFPHAVDSLIEHLTANNYDVTVERRTPTFAQLSVTPPHEPPLSVDLAIDWRAHTPVRLDIGPVLTLEDAIGNKLSALYSRSYPRDYLDVDRDSLRACQPIQRTDNKNITLTQILHTCIPRGTVLESRTHAVVDEHPLRAGRPQLCFLRIRILLAC